jgi:phosphoribosylformylglycinamidine cyclo-ligase
MAKKKKIDSGKGMTYAGAGVDIKKADKLVSKIKTIAARTATPSVIGGIGGFGGLYFQDLRGVKESVLVSSTDGVGTKLKIAFMTGKHDTVGIDLVGMCVNDVIVQGAKPLFFLDYFATGKLDNVVAEEVIKGIANGCIKAGCPLLGGETAEMPGFYQPGEYDLSGFTVGQVEKSKIIDGSKVKEGNALIGILSSGLHSNGFSLVRKIIFEKHKMKIDDYVQELGKTIGEELLTPTRIYVKPILSLLDKVQVNGIANITGGGLTENIPRILPNGLGVSIDNDELKTLPIFSFLQKLGKVPDDEMRRTFNNGIGMVVVVPYKYTNDAINHLKDAGEKAWYFGQVESLKRPVFSSGERVVYYH